MYTLTVESEKSLKSLSLPLQGEGRDGDGFKVKSKLSPSLTLEQSSAFS